MNNSTNQKKLRVGWFSFTCCEDSTIIMTELLNEYFFTWKKLIDFRHAKVLQAKNVLDQMDVAFIEGAISSNSQIEKVKKIRSFSKKIVAIGSCAVTGFPSAQRNLFDEKIKLEIKPILEKFNYSQKVLRLNEVIKVDEIIPGCPMQETVFLNTLNKLLKEFGITNTQKQQTVQPKTLTKKVSTNNI